MLSSGGERFDEGFCQVMQSTRDDFVRQEARGARQLSRFARRLLAEWRRLELPSRGRVVVAVSGGADSAALLLSCEELVRAGRLTIEIVAAHLNHNLRGEAGDEDARRVEELARSLKLAATVGRVEVGRRALTAGDNLEQAARLARYEFLSETAQQLGASAVLTGHTLDDQAETVLLRLLRGSGAEGLGGMRARRPLVEGGEAVLARPLLGWARRTTTEDYARARGFEPCVDEMNADETFARVRVRRRLLPLLESFNPRIVETLARTAELLREDARALEGEAAELLREACGARECEPGEVWPLRVSVLVSAPRALRRRALRQWIAAARGNLRRVESVHVEALERLLEGERGGRVAELPGKSRVERRRGWLVFRRAGEESG